MAEPADSWWDHTDRVHPAVIGTAMDRDSSSGAEPFGGATVFRTAPTWIGGTWYGAAKQLSASGIVLARLTWMCCRIQFRLPAGAFLTLSPIALLSLMGSFGVALSICRVLIEAHPGRAWAAPNLPRRTTVLFTAPFRHGAAP
jgi:hypothetical protein